MPNAKSNFIDDGLEFLQNHWLTLTGILVVLLLLAGSYIGFIRDTADDKYRQKLRYYSYDPIHYIDANSSTKDLSAPPISGRRIEPGKRTAARLYVKNVSRETIPAFRLELKNYASEVVMFDSTCIYPRIPPDSIVVAGDEIAFEVKPGYHSPYVAFLGKVESLVKQSSVVGDWLSITPENPLMVVMPMDSDELDPTYFVGTGACGYFAKPSPTAADSLKIGLSLFNNTEQLGQNVWIQMKPLMLVLRDKQSDSTSTFTFLPSIRSAHDSVSYGNIVTGGFFRPLRQFVFALPDLGTKEIRCALFEVYVYVHPMRIKSLVIAIEPARPVGVPPV